MSAAACENDNNFAIETFSVFSKTETVVHINFCISTSEMSLGFISLRNFHSMSVTQHLNYFFFFFDYSKTQTHCFFSPLSLNSLVIPDLILLNRSTDD